MVVGPVDLRSGEPSLEPAKERLVPRVHAERDLRLPTIAAEAPLPDEDADKDPPVQFAEITRFHVLPDGVTRTGRIRWWGRPEGACTSSEVLAGRNGSDEEGNRCRECPRREPRPGEPSTSLNGV